MGMLSSTQGKKGMRRMGMLSPVYARDGEEKAPVTTACREGR